jgi:transcriptional regulator with XRE-family HTH domain
MVDVGLNIRKERKKLNLSIKELAAKVGISTMTLQRIEMGKTSPSVSILAEISYHLRKPIGHFIEEKTPKIVFVRSEDQLVEISPKMKLTMVAPANFIDDRILVNLGEAKKGRFIDQHVEEGRSFVYILEGEAVLKHDGIEYVHKTGDSVYYDARYPHSVEALSKKLSWVSIFFKGKE